MLYTGYILLCICRCVNKSEWFHSIRVLHYCISRNSDFRPVSMLKQQKKKFTFWRSIRRSKFYSFSCSSLSLVSYMIAAIIYKTFIAHIHMYIQVHWCFEAPSPAPFFTAFYFFFLYFSFHSKLSMETWCAFHSKFCLNCH